MFPCPASMKKRVYLVLLLCLSFLGGCAKKESAPSATSEPAKPQTAAAPPISSPDEPPAPTGTIDFPKAFGRRTGDLDEMAKNRNIRALVLLNPIGFFYDKGHPQGVMYEAMEEFQKFANQKLKSGKLDVKVTFIPMRVDQIEAALNEGVGDIIASGIMVTPEREQRVAFSTPIQTDVAQIIVTGKNFGAVSSLADLGRKEVYVNPLTTYYANLQKVNETLQKDGKTPIVIKEADKNLMDDDLVQMVNAGLIPATVTTKQKAALWTQVLTGIQPHPDLAIATGADVQRVPELVEGRIEVEIDPTWDAAGKFLVCQKAVKY